MLAAFSGGKEEIEVRGTPVAAPGPVGGRVAPLAVVVHGLPLVDLAFGDRVVILGCGTIGVMTALAARVLGAAEIAVTYRYQHQARAALAAGATRAVSAGGGSGPRRAGAERGGGGGGG